MDEEGRGFESRRCQYKIVIFCRDRDEEKLETPDFKETRQEAIRINLLQLEVAPSNNIVV